MLLKLFESYCNGGGVNLTEPSVRWTEIEKLELGKFFWNFAARMFGYVNEDNPRISDFLIRLFVTDFANQLKTGLPAPMAHFAIQSPDHAMNATVLLAQWRSNLHHFKTYNRISNHIGKRLKIEDLLIPCPAEDLRDVMTFEAVERRIISGLRDRIIKGADTGDAVRRLIKTRLDGYWATAVLDASGQANSYRTIYAALESALRLFDLRNQYGDGFSFQNVEAMFNAYAGALFQFDQLYRRFSELSDGIETAGWELALTYLNEKAKPHVAPLAEKLEASIFQACDVREEGQLEAVFKTIEERWGEMDFLIHSIAFAPREDLKGRVIDCSREGFGVAMYVSCHSFLRMARYAEPLMPNGGALFAMSYYGSEKVVEHYEHYNLMGLVKAALEASVRYVAHELGSKGIRACIISPGPVKTRAASGIDRFDNLINRAKERAPVHKLVTIDDVGNATAMLAGDAGKLITGVTLYIDGGYHILG